MHEWIGIVGSIMIIIAFAQKDEKTIRILDAVGALLFIAYGFVTKTWSTMVLNIILVLVHVWRFIGIRKENGK